MVANKSATRIPQTSSPASPASQRLLDIAAVAAVVVMVVVSGTGRATAAEPVIYHATASVAGSPSCQIEVPYTFGTHGFEVREIGGQMRVDWGTPLAASGRLTVPLASLRGGGETLNCHMREALGLDYSKSAFPREHVCSGGQLPASGKDALAFPEIAFDVKAVALVGVAPSAVSPVGAGVRRRVLVSGRFTIHGISRDDKLDLWMTVGELVGARPRTIHIKGRHTIRLSDYGITVKRALMIKAGDEAVLNLDVALNEVP